jgi:putative membrane protein
MSKFKTVVGGFFIGLANIIPGVSGGTMAVIFGIYEMLIHGILSLFKTPLQAIKALYPILIGLALGIVFGVFVIDFGYREVPLLTTLIFIGLILGGIESIYKKIQHRDFAHITVFGIAFVLMVLLPILKSNITVHTGVVYYLMLLLVGFIAAGTMIAPGISGSLVLLLLGYYAHVLSLAKGAIEAVLALDFVTLFELLPAILVFLVGALIGLIVFSKIISFIMKSYESLFYAGILGLLIASPMSVLTMLHQTKPLQTFGLLEILFGIILCIGAAYGSYVIIKNSEN